MTDRAVEIRVKGLKKAFEGHVVLDGIDLEIHRGDVVAIVGGSGSGKTVLLNHILGLLRPDAGRVLVADHAHADAPLVDVAGLSGGARDAIHMHWGMVFQRNALFSGTVFDNIALWLREVKDLEDDAIYPIAREVLTAVQLPDADDFLDNDIASLSGGMAKRLAVARALAMNPVVLFYDEPTTGLDPTSAAHIQDLILTAHMATSAGRPRRTTVIITHDKDLLNRLEPRVIMLHRGVVAFDGPFVDFEASDSPIIRPYFDLMPLLQLRNFAGDDATAEPGQPPS